jgi:hypothetical protein
MSLSTCVAPAVLPPSLSSSSFPSSNWFPSPSVAISTAASSSAPIDFRQHCYVLWEHSSLFKTDTIHVLTLPSTFTSEMAQLWSYVFRVLNQTVWKSDQWSPALLDPRSTQAMIHEWFEQSFGPLPSSSSLSSSAPAPASSTVKVYKHAVTSCQTTLKDVWFLKQLGLPNLSIVAYAPNTDVASMQYLQSLKSFLEQNHASPTHAEQLLNKCWSQTSWEQQWILNASDPMDTALIVRPCTSSSYQEWRIALLRPFYCSESGHGASKRPYFPWRKIVTPSAPNKLMHQLERNDPTCENGWYRVNVPGSQNHELEFQLCTKLPMTFLSSVDVWIANVPWVRARLWLGPNPTSRYACSDHWFKCMSTLFPSIGSGSAAAALSGRTKGRSKRASTSSRKGGKGKDVLTKDWSTWTLDTFPTLSVFAAGQIPHTHSSFLEPQSSLRDDTIAESDSLNTKQKRTRGRPATTKEGKDKMRGLEDSPEPLVDGS